MSFYSQWIKDPKLSQVVWVCGSERILVNEVLDYVRSSIKVNSLNFSLLDAEKSGSIWDVINQRTIVETEDRLVIVKNAQRLESINPLKEWIKESKTSFPNTYLCFISEDEHTPEDITFLKPPKVTVVTCSKLSREDLVLWVKRNSPLSERSSKSLLDHVAGSLTDAKALCTKLSAILEGQSLVNISSDMLSSLVDETPSEFVDSLMSLDKKRALVSLQQMTQDECYRAISLLELRLSQLSRLQKLLQSKVVGRELSKIPGLPYPVVQELLPVSKYYNKSRILSCRQYIAMIDSYHNQGVYSGTLESLIAMW